MKTILACSLARVMMVLTVPPQLEMDIKAVCRPGRFEHFHEWKRLAEDQLGVLDMETLLKGVFGKENFIDLLENFIVFDDSAGAPGKILARNHQVLGVNRAIEAVHHRQDRGGKLGVFWHTQGAGKSYSMVLFTRKVHRKLGGNFTFVVLTDRDDLDTQIYKTLPVAALSIMTATPAGRRMAATSDSCWASTNPLSFP